MNEDEPRRSKGHCKQSGTGSWQSVITSGIFLLRCVWAHPVTHLYLHTESQDGPIPWPWAVPIPTFIACLIPVNRKQAGELPVKLLSCKSEDWKCIALIWLMQSNSAFLRWEESHKPTGWGTPSPAVAAKSLLRNNCSAFTLLSSLLYPSGLYTPVIGHL